MKQPGRRPLGRLTLRCFLVLSAALAAILCILLAARLLGAMDELRAAPHDNLQWSLSQLEVDLLKLESTAVSAQSNGGQTVSLAPVRRAFDLFYSRVDTIAQGRSFADLRRTEVGASALAQIDLFLDSFVPLVDSSDSELEAGLGDLVAAARALRFPTRELALEGVSVFAGAADAARAEFQRLVWLALLAAGSLLLLLGLLVSTVIAQGRRSARQAADVALSEARLSSVINASLDAILAIDSTGQVVEFNEAAQEMFGYRPDEALGRDVADLILPERMREASRANLERFNRTGVKTILDKGRVESTAVRRDGTEFPTELSVKSVQVNDGITFVAFVRDISVQKAASQALEKARDDALAGDRAKSRFIAVMSHEMRTPLNGLLGTLDLLERSTLSQEDRDLVRIATSSAEVLLRHVNDVLELSRLEGHEAELRDENVDLGAIIRDVAALHRPLAAQGVRLWTQVEPGFPMVRGDGHKLRQILMNLVGNAVKFTRQGSVQVSLARRSVGAKDQLYELIVSDTGVGIPADQTGRVFEDFVMLDDSYQRQASGTGLGLAITKRLVTAMDGAISLESAPGHGSSFRVLLPLIQGYSVPTPEMAATEPSPEVSRRLKILLVEDNEVNRTVASRMLDAEGHQVIMAHDGPEGVLKAQESAFDLILMDISMPGMDGVEATSQIRDNPGPSQAAPIFGLTAHALPSELPRFKSAGMQRCLVKPLRMNLLREELAAIADPEELRTNETAPDLIDSDILFELDAALGRDPFLALLAQAVNEIEAARPILTRQVAEGAHEDLAKLAHKVAGSAAVVGAAELHHVAADLEAAAKLSDNHMAALTVHRFDAIAGETATILKEYGQGL